MRVNGKRSRSIHSLLFVPPATVLIASLFVAPDLARPDDGHFSWPGWRGGDRAASIGVAVALPGSEEGALWSIEVGGGQASPVTVEVNGEQRVFVHSRQNDQETIRALSLATGKTIWKREFEEVYEPYPGAATYGKGAKSTPTVADGRVCALSVSGTVTCLRAETGELLWRKDSRSRFSQTYPPFGASSSPLFVGDALIVHIGGHPEGALAAFDPETGREIWAYEGEGPGYSSPIAVELDGRLQVVTQAHRNIVSVDAVSGELLWKYPSVTPCNQNVPTPLVVGDKLVFSSVDSGVFALQPRRAAAGWEVKEVWRNREVALYMSSAVLADDRIVGYSHRRRGQLFALEPRTGTLEWSSEGGLGEHASLLAQEDRVLIFFLSGEFRVLSGSGGFRLSESRRVAAEALWAHPVPTSVGWLLRQGDELALLGTGP